MTDAIARLFLSEIRRRLLDESVPRLRRCLDLLDDEQIWWRPNAASNAVGNLVLHACGNANQWIVHALGGARDHRRRQAEFDERGPLPRAQLLERLATTAADVAAVLDRIDSAALVGLHPVQGYEETGVGILVHVAEHFSYHVGQVGTLTKLLTAKDLGYYRHQDLDVTG
jgi:uncharacterized damage-inducible protein DinB